MSDFREFLQLLRATQSELEDIASRVDDHADELEVLVETQEDEVEAAAEEELKVPTVVVDASGHILVEGHYVGWLDPNADRLMVEKMFDLLNCRVPPLQDMKEMVEKESR